ncbi:NAD-dependent formate dehydrogenase [Lentinus brumalis]|uniref:Formate dehydrogenase n=1 Tax=Lentinus brumalis TaxID=2498619 RepID=A0A371DRA5_9APHY|nr:NAD-dependent formate dehydrogenase [Polyporus brumalis]
MTMLRFGLSQSHIRRGLLSSASSRSPRLLNSTRLAPSLSYQSIAGMKVLAVLYSGGEAAQQEPRLLGTTENQLGIREWLEKKGHEFIVTDDKEGPNSVFQKNIVDAEVLITTPFHPGYLTRDLIDKAKNLKICITAGVGSDHIDLNAAVEKGIEVLEVSGSNVVSVAEHVIMSILLLVRNFVPAHEMIERGDWQVSQIARAAYDLEGKVVGTIGAGRIGYRVLQRLVPFNCKELLYYDYAALPEEAAKAVNARRIEDLKEFVSKCDVVTVNCPLHEGTRGLVNEELLKHFKKGAWLVNTARGAICDKDAVAAALKSGQLFGYSGDVWNVQPAPKDHPWRTMKNPLGGGNGMVPHYSGTTLDAQARYAAGTKSILENYLENKPQEPQNIIVGKKGYETKAYGQR